MSVLLETGKPVGLVGWWSCFKKNHKITTARHTGLEKAAVAVVENLPAGDLRGVTVPPRGGGRGVWCGFEAVDWCPLPLLANTPFVTCDGPKLPLGGCARWGKEKRRDQASV